MMRLLRKLLHFAEKNDHKAVVGLYEIWNTNCQGILKEMLLGGIEINKYQANSRQQLKSIMDIQMFQHIYEFSSLCKANPSGDPELKEIQTDVAKLLHIAHKCREQIDRNTADSIRIADHLLMGIDWIRRATLDFITGLRTYTNLHPVDREVEEICEYMLNSEAEFYATHMEDVAHWINMIKDHLRGKCRCRHWRKRPIASVLQCFNSDVIRCVEYLTYDLHVFIDLGSKKVLPLGALRKTEKSSK